jgi:hypothetical protein
MSTLATLQPVQSNLDNEDIELNDITGVVSREAGERDPLLLRSKIVSDSALDGLKE